MEMKTQQAGPVRARKSKGRNYSPYIEEQTRSGNKNTRRNGNQQQKDQERKGGANTSRTISLEVLVGDANYKTIFNCNGIHIFGWVVLGKTKLSCQRIISNHASYNAVEFQLDKFWQLEELGETKPFTNEEIACENNFKRTHTRDSTGRFVVNFPFRDSSDELGSSRDTAVHRLQQIERRFSKNKSLSNQYHKFMNDYLKFGHMELIPENEIDVPASSSFYLPHHPVPNKNGDKFRVVFDGSAKSSSGVSTIN
ncbi:uncharacterized protein LOC103569155 [Trichonephila clavipes]|nr:uncharacterized protein LOC103569155 [Trichonephila clavipes]